MAIHAFFLFPETAGKTLEEIEELFLAGVPAWKTKVDFQNMRRAEHGEVDEKRLGMIEQERVGAEKV